MNNLRWFKRPSKIVGGLSPIVISFGMILQAQAGGQNRDQSPIGILATCLRTSL
jgi:hypothetical protein